MNVACVVRHPWAPALLMIASGFAGLGYQVVWTEQCALWLGHESAAVLAVVAAFATFAERRGHARPSTRAAFVRAARKS